MAKGEGWQSSDAEHGDGVAFKITEMASCRARGECHLESLCCTK